MYTQTIIITLLAALQIQAVPLNINLGAYSPALVVGDGEISVGGTEGASKLMETLATGAAANAAANGAPAPEGQAAPPPGEATPPPPAEAAVETPPADETVEGDGVSAAIRQGFNEGSFPNLRARAVNAQEQSADGVDLARLLRSRDLAQTLAYAAEANKNQPEIELATGKEGSGVGIIINPGVNVPVESAANGAEPAAAAGGKEKRDLDGVAKKQGITLLAMMEI